MSDDPEIRAAEAGERLEGWRGILTRADAASTTDETIAELLGSASVATMAEIESFMRDLVESITSAINNEGCAVSSLRPELRVLHAYRTFDSIRNIEMRNNKYWQSRIDLARLHASSEIASLPERSRNRPQAPLRGSTIALRDISEVATIFGFPHPSQLTENGLQVTSLKKMAEYRNAYAHAEASPIEIFPNPRRELRNVLKYIAHIFDLLNVLAKNWKTVLTERLYLTSTALQHISVIQHDTSQPIKS
jgi:hypothetical protein